MTALARNATVAAFPLGRPVDRDRYGMTREQSILYRWLVENKPHDKAFSLNARAIAKLFVTTNHSHIFERTLALIERGWLEKEGPKFRFVEPIKHFKGQARG